MASIGDLFFAFHGDDSQLQLDATKAGQTAGTQAGGSFSGAFGSIVKTAAAAVIGAGIGLALKAITAGAVELDAATRKYQADTGATIEETKLAGEQINALFKTNVDSYAQIGDVLAKLRTDLHITGDAAQGLAQDFLHYALATGQEPVAATDALTTAIKAWRVPASQIPALMDEIVKGHQLYGGSIEENVTVLAKLAPALTAANFTVNDATGLLNLFAASGLDSAKAAAAFQTALTKVKNPEALDALIARIQATTNDFDRAKLAIALFGTKAGPALADALAPGTKSLADYTITAAQSTGATNAAADAIDQGFGNQVVLAFHKVEGSLSGLATNAQPLVDVLDALGNMGVNVLPALGASLGVLAKQIVPEAQATGLSIGQAMQAGMIIGLTIGLPVLVLGAVQKAADAIRPKDLATGPGLVDLPKILFGGDPFGTKTGDPGGKIALDTKTAFNLAADYVNSDTTMPTAAADYATKVVRAFGGPLRDLATVVLEPLTITIGKANARLFAAMQLEVSNFQAMWAQLTGIASDAADAIYGPMIRADNLLTQTQQINAAKRTLADKNSTDAQKAAARSQLLSLEQSDLALRIEMAGRGELTKAQYAALIAELTKDAANGNAQVQNSAKLALVELAKLNAALASTDTLYGKVFKGPGGKGAGKLAAGGPSPEATSTLIGEEGPEIRVFAQDGYVLNHQEALSIAAGKYGPNAGASGALIGSQTNHVYGIQPDSLERQMNRSLRMAQLQARLSGSRA